MNTESSVWRRLSPDTIAEVPEAGGVFELANLVRTVHYIGSGGGNLRARLASWAQEQTKLTPQPGGYYVRYEPATKEDEALTQRLDAYRAGHGGLLPVGNRGGSPVLRVASRHAA
jgi:hypothetical protein